MSLPRCPWRQGMAWSVQGLPSGWYQFEATDRQTYQVGGRLRVSTDLSVLFEYYDALRKEAKAARQSEDDTAENIYAQIG